MIFSMVKNDMEKTVEKNVEKSFMVPVQKTMFEVNLKWYVVNRVLERRTRGGSWSPRNFDSGLRSRTSGQH